MLVGRVKCSDICGYKSLKTQNDITPWKYHFFTEDRRKFVYLQLLNDWPKMTRDLKILPKRYHCVQCFIYNLIRISLYPEYKFPHLSLSVSETNITMVKWFKTHAYRCQNVFYNEDITQDIGFAIPLQGGLAETTSPSSVFYGK